MKQAYLWAGVIYFGCLTFVLGALMVKYFAGLGILVLLPAAGFIVATIVLLTAIGNDK